MSTFKRYLAIQAMMFVFGIVGPIFLLLFFSSPADPHMRWAFWAGLFITYADVIIALWITKATLGNDREPRDVRVANAVAQRLQGRGGLGVDFFDSSASD